MLAKASHGFDYYVRSLITGALALGIVGAIIYDEIAHGQAPQLLVGWGGIVVGVYFGYHVTANGVAARRALQSQTVEQVSAAAHIIAETTGNHVASTTVPEKPA